MIRIRHVYNFEYASDAIPELSSQASLTRPDMTYTPKELLHRYQAGLPMDKLSNHHYSGDMIAPDPRTLDLTEQADMIRDARETVRRMDAELTAKEQARAAAAVKQRRQRDANNKQLMDAVEYLKRFDKQPPAAA